MFTRTLQEIADQLGVQVQGDPNCEINGIATLDRAKSGDLSFLTSKQYRKQLLITKASAIIMSFADSQGFAGNALISNNPRLCLAKAAKLFERETTKLMPGIHPTAVIGKHCQIDTSAFIGPQVVLGDNVTIGKGAYIEAFCSLGDRCSIGSESVLKPRVTLYHGVTVGSNCLIHSGAVLGSDGFGFANSESGWVKMPHLGGVVIGNFVEIGSNTTIDRGFLNDTIIHEGVIIDNLVQIGHNVSIGARTAIAGCTAIAGSVTIGENCLIGGGVLIAGHLEIANQVHLTGATSVHHSILKPGVYSSGFPAKPNGTWLKNVARFAYLDQLSRRVRGIEKKLSIETQSENQE